MSMIELTINGQKVQTKPKSTILQAATANGIYIPHLCWDRRLAPYGGCRLCLVEVEGQRKLLASCSTPAEANMIVQTDTPKLEKARKTVLELLLVHHPLDCPVCDKAGECKLQELAFKYGPSDSRFTAERKHEPESLAAPLIERNTNRCILCGKCVRVCKEHQGVGAINLIGRGFKTKVSPAFEETLDCEFCGQCVDSCPVGALGTKPYRFRSRVWFMDEQANVCPYCGVGCTTNLSLREGRIIRARGLDGVGLNEGDLCPRGRFGFDYIESEHRLSTPLLKKGEKLEPVSWQEALDYISRRLTEIKQESGAGAIGAIGSERCSLEDNYMLKKFMTALGSANIDSRAHLGYAKVARAAKKAMCLDAIPIDLNAPVDADVLFVVESDLTATHPVYGLKLLKARRDEDANLIVADAKETKLARWSTSWLRLKPATGTALVNGVMKVLIDENLASEKARSIPGFAELKKALEAYTPEKTAAITGIQAEDIVNTARALAKAQNPMLFASIGSSENTKGEDLILAIMDLAMLLGRGPECLGMPAEFANSMGVYDIGIRPGAGGLGLEDMLYKGKVKALYIMGENPAVTFPDAARVEQALRNLELLIVQDIMMSETAQLAHVVLPAASWAEKEGTFIGAHGRAQRFVKCLPETGLSIPDWKIFRNLGRAMGMDIGAKDEHELHEEMAHYMREEQKPDFKFVPVKEEAAVAAAAAADPAYPFVLMTGILMQHSGSLTTISKNITSAASDAYIAINPRDAQASKIKDEGYSKVIGREGAAIYVKARVTEEVPQGVLFIPAHFAHARVNLLTKLSSNGEAPIVAVKIEPA
jgi:NADH-quinone oxidoreductase subunit G